MSNIIYLHETNRARLQEKLEEALRENPGSRVVSMRTRDFPDGTEIHFAGIEIGNVIRIRMIAKFEAQIERLRHKLG